MHRQLKITLIIFLLALGGLVARKFATRAPQLTLQSVNNGITNTGSIAGAQATQSPQIKLRSVGGETFSLAEHKGRAIVFLFSATWSPLADKTLPAFRRLADRYADRAVSFYWVSIDSAKAGEKNYASDADLQAFVGRAGLHLTVLRDPDREAFRALGVDAIPTMVIIDREGQVYRRHVGFDPEQFDSYSEVVRSLDQLLK